MENPLSPPATPSVQQKKELPSLSFSADFIVVSEFSEIDGPIPRMVIPENSEGKFNISDFVVKIMAVDHQNKSSDISTSFLRLISFSASY